MVGVPDRVRVTARAVAGRPDRHSAGRRPTRCRRRAHRASSFHDAWGGAHRRDPRRCASPTDQARAGHHHLAQDPHPPAPRPGEAAQHWWSKIEGAACWSHSTPSTNPPRRRYVQLHRKQATTTQLDTAASLQAAARPDPSSAPDPTPRAEEDAMTARQRSRGAFTRQNRTENGTVLASGWRSGGGLST